MSKLTFDLIRELEGRSAQIKKMNLTTGLANTALEGDLINLENNPADLDRMASAIEALVSKAGYSLVDATHAVRLLIDERHFYGTYCELGAYDWFCRHNVDFAAQVKLSSNDVLNPNGCVIDGQFKTIDGYFDIKAMGFQAYVAEKFRAALAMKLPGFDVVINGAMDVAVKDIEKYAFGKLEALSNALADGKSYNISELGWTIRAQLPQKLTTTVQTINPYRLAEENRHYPLKTSGQFTQNAPFVLVFAYSAQFNLSLFINFKGSSDITLRSIARRVFIQLTTDSTPVMKYDKQTPPGVTVADAAKLIAGLMFINLDNDDAWLFLNPRAKNPLSEYQVEQIFDFSPPTSLGIDNFLYDDY